MYGKYGDIAATVCLFDNLPGRTLESCNSISSTIQELRFLFLSPCPQRILLSSIDFSFLFVLLIFATHKLYLRFASNERLDSGINKSLIENRRVEVRTNVWFNLSLFVSLLYAVGSVAFRIVNISRNTESKWKLVDRLFWWLQAFTHLVIALLVVLEKRLRAITHPLSIRIYWVVNFVVTTLFFASGLIRLIYFQGSCVDLLWDDIVSLISFPSSTVLLILAIKGLTGIVVVSDSQPSTGSDSDLNEPLLDKFNVSKFATASIVSKAFWIWMSPLLKKAVVGTVGSGKSSLLAAILGEMQRKLILQGAFFDLLLPSMEKEARALLSSMTKHWLVTEYGTVLWNKVSIGPYRRKETEINSDEEAAPKSHILLSWELSILEKKGDSI